LVYIRKFKKGHYFIMIDRDQIQHEEALELLHNYRAGKITPSSYHSMITQWGKAHLLEARADIEPFLSHSDVLVRSNALHVLAGSFQLQEYWSTAVQFLLYDPNLIAREEGITVLAWLKANTREQRTLAILARVVGDHYDDDMIRRDTYRAMRSVAYGNWERLDNPPESIFNVDRDADWDFIHASIDATLEQEWREEAQGLLEAYHQGKVAPQDYYAMMLKFGHANVQEARPVVASFLSSSNVDLRRIALRVLVLYLQVPGGWQMVVDALAHDADELYREEAVTDLGLLMRRTRDKATLRILIPFVYEGDASDLSTQAFLAIQKVYAHHFEEADYNEIDALLASPDDITGAEDSKP
jgi:hypothetical protein